MKKKIKPSTQKRREKRAPLREERQAIKAELDELGLNLGLVSPEAIDEAERKGIKAMRALLEEARANAAYEVGEGEAAAEAEAQAD